MAHFKATTTTDGVMIAADKSKLDGIGSGAQPVEVKENGVQVVAVATALDFTNSNDFGVIASGTEAHVTINRNVANGIAGLAADGAVDIAQGGTGETTRQAALDALAGFVTKGSILAGDGSDMIELAVGADGKFLKANSGEATGLEWVTLPSDVAVDTYRFTGLGTIVTTTKIDGAYIAPRAGTITRITLYRRTAGSAGTTIVDINKNGTTVFTTQANRPQAAFGDGNDYVDAHTDMDVTAVAQGDRIEVDVDSAETGAPKDLNVIIEITYP